MQVFQRARVALWTKEKIDSLSTIEVRQLRANAQRLDEADIATLCEQVLGERPRGLAAPRKSTKRRTDGRRLISRSLALGMRGVSLANRFWSRGGVRSADGVVMMMLWAEDVKHDPAGSSYLLWAPNVEGSRPWSDKPGGQERLEHCRKAVEKGGAEGLLVYGTRLEGTLPDDKALSVEGADPDNVLTLGVEKRAGEYWATWGGRTAAA